MTPLEIQNKTFEKKGMGGYRVEDVQAYLLEVAQYVEDVQEQNADLQRKLEILAEKVEQYREDEDSLRAALIGAQKLGDSVVRESKRKAEAIVAQATRQAEEIIRQAQENIEKESLALNTMQLEVAKFKEQILSLYKEHIQLVQQMPIEETPAPDLSLSNSEVQFVANIGETVDVKPAGTAAESTGEKQKAPARTVREKGKAEPEPAQPEDVPEGQISFEALNGAEESAEADNVDAFPKRKPTSRFGTLQFGDAYDLTRNE